MKPKLIAIAGGSGAGKSTVALALQDKHPDLVGLVQLDDYFKPEPDVPVVHGMINWDDPAALFFDKFVHDLAELKDGKTVMVNTKNRRLNPAYSTTKKRIVVPFEPKPIMIVEGYLALFDKQARDLLTTSIWLDAAHTTRWDRRVHFKDPNYEQKVFIPMHEKFVEPTKQYAKHVLNTSELSKEEVLAEVEKIVLSLAP